MIYLRWLRNNKTLRSLYLCALCVSYSMPLLADSVPGFPTSRKRRDGWEIKHRGNDFPRLFCNKKTLRSLYLCALCVSYSLSLLACSVLGCPINRSIFLVRRLNAEDAEARRRKGNDLSALVASQ